MRPQFGGLRETPSRRVMATVEIERVAPEEVGTLPSAKVSGTQQRSAETLAFKSRAEN